MRMPLQKYPQPEITHFDSCESTNQLLLAAAESGAASGSVYQAHRQIAGRGRRGRQWFTSPGHGLACSVLWVFPAEPLRLQGLPLLVGLALARALADPRLGKHQPDVRCGLKWPNDLLLQSKDGGYAKLGGILVESVVRSTTDGHKELAVVIGIGLNCLADPALQPVISTQKIAAVSDLLATPRSPQLLLPLILDQLFPMLAQFAVWGFEPFVDDWNAHDLWRHREVLVTEDGVVRLAGQSLGVDATGTLQLETAHGIKQAVSGDVSLRSA